MGKDKVEMPVDCRACSPAHVKKGKRYAARAVPGGALKLCFATLLSKSRTVLVPIIRTMNSTRCEVHWTERKAAKRGQSRGGRMAERGCSGRQDAPDGSSHLSQMPACYCMGLYGPVWAFVRCLVPYWGWTSCACNMSSALDTRACPMRRQVSDHN